jgi:hypothetical protein
MSQTEYNNQILEGDDVARLLGTLPRVEAPSDFEFRVRARIASGRPARKQFSWIPAPVRVAAPLALVIGVGGYFGYSALNIGGVATPMATSNPVPVSTVAVAAPLPSIETSPPEIASTAKKRVETTGRAKVVKASRAITSRPAKAAGASYDEASTKGTVIKLPTASTVAKPDDAQAPGIFRSAGVDVVSAGSGWRVEAVTTGGLGDRAGLRPGDVIDAVAGPNLRGTRDGKPIDLVIKP